MAGLQSFEDFTRLKAEKLAAVEAQKQTEAREETARSFKDLLAEYGVTKVSELDEEKRSEFFSRLEGTDLNESLSLVTEGTRSFFGKIDRKGDIEAVYMHYDGYPENMLPLIQKGYSGSKRKNVEVVLQNGAGSGLEADPKKINYYNDGTKTLTGNAGSIRDFIGDVKDSWGEFIYLYDERDGKWYMADTYEDSDLKPAFESFLINENYEVIYSDGISAMKKFRSEAQALNFMRDTIKSNKKLKDIAVYKPGMYSTTQTELVVAFWGNGSYLDNVSKRDPKLAAKKLDEAVVTEANQDALKRMKEIIDIRSKMISDYTKKFPTVWTIETKFNASDTKKFRELQIEYKELEKEITNESLVTEASGNFPIQERRVAKKVVTQYNHIFGKKYTSLVDGGKTQLGAIKVIFQAAMEDANFSREGNEIMKNIKGALQNIVVPVSGLGNIEAKVSARRIQDALYDEASRISNAAEWGGLGIVEGTALYLESIGNEAMGAQLVAAFHAQFESREVMEARILEGNEFGAARAKAIADGEDEFEVDGETYKVTKVDKEDKENAEDFAGESVVAEAEVKSDEEFKEYAFTVLKKAFGEDFDEAKAQEVVDGILSKADGDYGTAVGILTSSLG